MEVRLQLSRQSEPMSHLVAFTGAGPLGHPKIFINLVCAIILVAPNDTNTSHRTSQDLNHAGEPTSCRHQSESLLTFVEIVCQSL